jgi:hypothetical protein
MSCEELSMSCPKQPAPGLHFDNAIVAKIDLNPVTAAVIKLATNADKYGHRHRRQARFRRLLWSLNRLSSDMPSLLMGVLDFRLP